MLRTPRLILREPRLDDLAPMFAAYSDPRAMRYWSTAPHADPSVTQDLLDRRMADWEVHQRNFQIERDGVWIGNAGMFRDYEVGFMLAPDHWRQGFMSEALGAIIPHLFDTIGVPHLTADADPENAASVGLLNALGFQETHREKNTFLIDGVWSGSVYFRLDPR